MKRRTFIAGAAATLVAAPHLSSAQELSKTPRIAYVSRGIPGDFRIQSFLQGLRDFGYVEGENISIEYYWFREFGELPQLLPGVVASRPDAIVAIQTPTALAAKSATEDIPIVIAGIGDAVAVDIVASLARPGANITGVSLNMADTAGKRLQFLTELIPGLAHVAIIYASNNAAHVPILAQAHRDGQLLGLDIRDVGVTTVDDMDNVLRGLTAGGVQAVVIVADVMFTNNATTIAELAHKHRLPIAYDFRTTTDAGGLFSYGANLAAHFQRSAYFVDRILKGAKPADLPVEQPTVYDLIINLKTAAELGITIPPALMILATEFIE